VFSGIQSVFERIEPHDHLVEFYDDDGVLTGKIAHFLANGWERGEAVVAVATGHHKQAIFERLDRLGIDPCERRRACFLDAHEILERILVDGRADWTRFGNHVAAVVHELQARHGSVRAFGELVGVLWRRDQLAAALRIEEFWSRTLSTCNVSLFCAYPIDLLSRRFDGQAVNAILRAHTHLLPFGPDGELQRALGRAMDDVLGTGAKRVREVVGRYFRPCPAAVPDADAMVLWVRSNLPRHADQILARTRQYYRQTDAAAAMLSC